MPRVCLPVYRPALGPTSTPTSEMAQLSVLVNIGVLNLISTICRGNFDIQSTWLVYQSHGTTPGLSHIIIIIVKYRFLLSAIFFFLFYFCSSIHPWPLQPLSYQKETKNGFCLFFVWLASR
jgi:hypothetical protein